MYSTKLRYNSEKNRFEFRYGYDPYQPYASDNNNNYTSYKPNKAPLNSIGTSNYIYDINKDTSNIKFGKKMKRFTYSLFAYNILLVLLVIIYSSIIFDLDMLVNCIIFLVLFTASEALYIFYSLKLFIKKTLDENKNCYGVIVIVSAGLSFTGAMVDFTGGKLPVGHYVIFIGGISVLSLMSIVYFILVLKIVNN